MKANEILKFLDLEQGKASKSAIRGTWNAFGSEEEYLAVTPGSRLEKNGLRLGHIYNLRSALRAIGCEEKENA